MNQFLLYLASGLITVLVGYFTNQLPNLPENLKPWVPLALAVLTLVPTFRRSDSDGYDFLKKQSGKNLSTNFQVI
jgi:hypothetical protein